jgi:hypothetical protein
VARNRWWSRSLRALAGASPSHRSSGWWRGHLLGAHTRGDRLGMMARIEIGKPQAVVKERHLDLAVLQRARYALVVFRRQEIEHRRWMAPRSRQVGSSAPAERRSRSRTLPLTNTSSILNQTRSHAISDTVGSSERSHPTCTQTIRALRNRDLAMFNLAIDSKAEGPQWANSHGCRRATRASQCAVCRRWRRKRTALLYPRGSSRRRLTPGQS